MTYQRLQNLKQSLATSLALKASWKVYFYLTGTTTPTDTYTTYTLGTAHDNPVQADAGGVLPDIYLDPAIVYKAVVTDENDVQQGDAIDPVNDLLLDQATIGSLLYPRTAAEIAAGVTPTDYSYPPGNVKRYGALGDDDDDTTALANAALASRNLFFPAGTYNITTEIYYTGATPVSIRGEAGAYIQTTGATNRAIHIDGSPTGTTSGKMILIDNIRIIGANSGVADSAIYLDSVAVFDIRDVVILGNDKFTDGMLLYGAQQGHVWGGYIYGVEVGVHGVRSADEGYGESGSNGVEVHAISLNTTVAAIKFENTDSVFIHHNHIIGPPIGIHILSDTNTTPADVYSNHIEGIDGGGDVTAAILVEGAYTANVCIVKNILLVTGPGIDVQDGLGVTIERNTFSACDLVIGAGVTVSSLSNNYATSAATTDLTIDSTAIILSKSGNTREGSAFDWGDTLTPAQITANTDDYAPTGYGPQTKVLRLSTDVSRNLTGLTGGWDGRQIVIFNVGSDDLVLKDYTTSTAANRFAFGADKTIGAQLGITLQYESVGAVWRSAARLA